MWQNGIDKFPRSQTLLCGDTTRYRHWWIIRYQRELLSYFMLYSYLLFYIMFVYCIIIVYATAMIYIYLCSLMLTPMISTPNKTFHNDYDANATAMNFRSLCLPRSTEQYETHTTHDTEKPLLAPNDVEPHI